MSENHEICGEVRLSLENIILPATKLATTPSEVDGLPKHVEAELRHFGCGLIQTAGIGLDLSQEILTTAQVLFHRFYHAKSFLWNPVEIIASGCLFLAAKLGEDRRPVEDIVHQMTLLKNSGTFIAPIDSSHVLRAEKKLLTQLGFMVYVQTPFKGSCNVAPMLTARSR